MRKNVKNLGKFSIYLLLAFVLLTGDVRSESEVYFSPNGGCEKRAVEFINQSKGTLDLALFRLHSRPVINALIAAKGRGVRVRILLDRTQAKLHREVSFELKDGGFDVRLHSMNRAQNNRFAITDGTSVLSGTYDWTSDSEKQEEANCEIHQEESFVNKFVQRFEKHLWKVNSHEKSERSFANMKRRANIVREPGSYENPAVVPISKPQPNFPNFKE